MNGLNDFFGGVTDFFARVFPGLTMGHMVVAAVLLLLLFIIFLCVAIAKGRVNSELREKYVQAQDDIKNREDDIKKLTSDAAREKSRIEDELKSVKAEKDELIADLSAQLDVRNQFYDKYKVIPDAEKEATRILGEAKDKAFIVANRTEKEYVELIEQANKEAESIRQLANERLSRSHETLKSAIARANEIVDEARGDVLRGAVTYVPQQARIQAPGVNENEDVDDAVEDD